MRTKSFDNGSQIRKKGQVAMYAKNNATIGIVGSGGDGVVLLGTLLQRLAVAAGYYGQMEKYYGAQIRGGSSAVKLNICCASSAIPGDILDVLVCFNEEKAAEFPMELAVDARTVVLCEADALKSFPSAGIPCAVPFVMIGRDATGNAQDKNIVALGVLTEMFGFDPRLVERVMVSDGKFDVIRNASAAFERGRAIGRGLKDRTAPLATPIDASPKLIMSGNEVAVEAAIAAGCGAYFFYPITPASEIATGMSKKLRATGGVFLQTEDEISMIHHAIGASLAGRKSMLATSGPGFSLLSEAIGAAIGIEAPLVILDVQRCGPGTGIPTKSEQSDLFHALYTGHGDAPRVVLAPYDIISVWELIREAFNLAEQYQTPVIVLSDQLLGQTPVVISDSCLKAGYPVVNRLKPANGGTEKYRRYLDTPDGISPMSDIGDPGGIFQISAHSRTEDARHNYSHLVLEHWHEKIARKLSIISSRNHLVRLYGDPSAKDRVITWGSSAQAVLAAVEASGLADRIEVCVPGLISPFPEIAERFVNEAQRLMVVELNYSAQFYRYLRSVAYPPRDTTVYKRSGAQPFSIGEIAEAIRRSFGEKEVR